MQYYEAEGTIRYVIKGVSGAGWEQFLLDSLNIVEEALEKEEVTILDNDIKISYNEVPTREEVVDPDIDRYDYGDSGIYKD